MPDQVLIVADGTLAAPEALVDAVRRAGLSVALEPDPTRALAALRLHPRPVVLDVAMPEAEAFVARLRAEGDLVGCAVIAVVADGGDAAFITPLAWGVDETVPLTALRSLTTALAALRGHDPRARPPATQGRVLVAAASSAARLALGRPLRNAGYGVEFAVDVDGLASQIVRPDVLFAVIDEGVFPEGAPGLRALIGAFGAERSIVAVVPHRDVDRISAEISPAARVRVISNHAPPEDAIFLGNALVRPQLTGRSISPRLLHTAVVAFRPAGAEHATYGVTYNLSASGLYVRTLAAPPAGANLWLELRPPCLEARVHLEARVAWAPRFGATAGAIAPAGFGAHITGGSAQSLARWLDGYQSLLARRGDATSATPSVAPGAATPTSE